MKIVEVPADLMLRSLPGVVNRTRGRNCEEIFCDYAREHAASIESRRAYLPIHWWLCVVRDTQQRLARVFRSVPEVQQFLDGLDQSAAYMTVSRCDDGIYERLPPDTVVFSTSGAGDIPIPLLPPGVCRCTP